MIKTTKKLLIVAMVLFTGFCQQTLNVKASNSYTVNGVTVQYYDFSSEPNQCWRYANNMYTKIWGVGVSSTTGTCNILTGLSVEEKRLNEEHLKKYIGYAALGSCIRLTSYSGLFSSGDFIGHSQILVQKDENGFTILEGGMSTPGARREHYYTWSEYCRTWSGPNYHYIKYIVYPNSIHLVDIDPVKEEALLTHIEEMSVQETKNEMIERTVNATRLLESTPEIAVAYEKSVEGHIITLNRCTMSFMCVLSTFYFHIYKKNNIANNIA